MIKSTNDTSYEPPAELRLYGVRIFRTGGHVSAHSAIPSCSFSVGSVGKGGSVPAAQPRVRTTSTSVHPRTHPYGDSDQKRNRNISVLVLRLCLISSFLSRGCKPFKFPSRKACVQRNCKVSPTTGLLKSHSHSLNFCTNKYLFDMSEKSGKIKKVRRIWHLNQGPSAFQPSALPLSYRPLMNFDLDMKYSNTYGIETLFLILVAGNILVYIIKHWQTYFRNLSALCEISNNMGVFIYLSVQLSEYLNIVNYTYLVVENILYMVYIIHFMKFLLGWLFSHLFIVIKHIPYSAISGAIYFSLVKIRLSSRCICHPWSLSSLFYSRGKHTNNSKTRPAPDKSSVDTPIRPAKKRKRSKVANPAPKKARDLSPVPTSTDKSCPNPTADDRVISGLCFNARGMKTVGKIEATKTRTIGEDIFMLSESNLRPKDAQLLVNKGLGVSARISACNKTSYDKHGNRTTVKSKLSGYGTAMISRKHKLVEYLHVGTEHEIIIGKISIKDVSGLIVTVYRSPSMTKKPDIDKFYNYISTKIHEYGGVKSNDFILYIGDDNCILTDLRRRHVAGCQNLLAETFLMVNLIGNIPTRGTRQPDSCLAYFNPTKVDICATVQAKIHGDMDHYPIAFYIRALGVVPQLPKYKLIERKKMIWSDIQISRFLTEHFTEWTKKWSFSSKPSSDTVEKMTDAFETIISKLKAKAWKTKLIFIPFDVPEDNRDPLVINILQEKSKLQKIAFSLRDSTDSRSLREEYVVTMNKLREFSRQKAKQDIEIDYKHQKDSEMVTTRYFYRTISKLTGKDSFNATPDGEQSDEQLFKRLEANDLSFITDIDTPVFDPASVTPDRNYELADRETLLEIIKKTAKIEDLFTNHFDQLTEPILHLAEAMQTAQHHPKRYRTSKATVIPKRAIFSLSAMPKIIERLFYNAFQHCVKLGYGKNGDPLQMAYESGRGVVSCNAITLSEIEKSLIIDEKSVIQIYMDLKKAFNKINRHTALMQAQKICGAGKILSSWFKDRIYTYKGQTRGLEFNCGVPAGTLWGVLLFKLFITTDRALTAFNRNLLWACGYSDDRSPVCNSTNIRNGNMQDALDESWKWAEDQGSEYHIDGDKKPVLLCFETRHDRLSAVDRALVLGVTPVEEVKVVKSLGLTIATHAETPEERKLINAYGYILLPDISTIKSLAYRIRSIAFDVVPEMRHMMVSSQFCGKLRFAASLYYLRASTSALNSIRFYHGLAAASVCGLSVYEIFGASCCRYQSICFDNKCYSDLLDLCSLPTFRDMAIIDARSVIKQMVTIRSNWFKRLEQLSLVELNKQGLPTTVNPKLKHTLVGELFALAHSKTRSELKQVKIDINHSNVWTKTVSMCTDVVSHRREIELCLYSDYMRHEMKCLNANYRRLKYLTPTRRLILNPEENCQRRPPDKIGAACGPNRLSKRRLTGNSVTVTYIRDKCLICGDKGPSGSWVSANESIESSRWGKSACPKTWLRCNLNCGFGAHRRCIVDHRKLRPTDWTGKTIFCCNDISLQLHRKELIDLVKDRVTGELKDEMVSKCEEAVIKRQEKRPRSENRYANDLTSCNKCGMYYDLHTVDHLLNDCAKFGDPRPTERVHGPPLKRMRDDTWNDPDSWDRLYFFVSHDTP